MADSAVRRLLDLAVLEKDALSEALEADRTCPELQARIQDWRSWAGEYAPRFEDGGKIKGSGGGFFPAGETAKLLDAMRGRTSPPPGRDFDVAYKAAIAEVMDRPAATVLLAKLEALKAARESLMAGAVRCYKASRGTEGLTALPGWCDAFWEVEAFLDGIEGPQSGGPSLAIATNQHQSIEALGDGIYRVAGVEHRVTESEECVLAAFLKRPAMTEKELVGSSGYSDAPRILRRLKRKFEGALAAAIRLPGGKGKGGYSVRITES